MTISGKILYDKIQSLRPGHWSGVTIEMLERVCDDSNVQPFLKWFCDNVTQCNVLTDEELQLKNQLQKANEWLEESELDNALEEAVQDCPELLKVVQFDDECTEDLLAEYEITKELEKEDDEYIETLQNAVKNLRLTEAILEENIEGESTLLEKERIETLKIWEACSETSDQFDDINSKFSQDVKELLEIYAGAAKNKETPIVWTQMPLELFVKQIELYNSYIGLYIKREFGLSDKEDDAVDSDYASLINDSKDKFTNARELRRCESSLANAKLREIIAKIRQESNMKMLEYVQKIYNDGNVRTPKQSEIRMEIVELTAKRDSLEAKIDLLRDQQLMHIVQQSAALEIMKILKDTADTRLERRNIRLKKLKNLEILVKDNGHIHADLLCILMGLQIRQIKDVSEFFADARHYLSTEYLYSSTRRESMQRVITEYAALLSQSTKGMNSFHKFLGALVCSSDGPHELNTVLEKYNDILNTNKSYEQKILDLNLNSRIAELKDKRREVSVYYENEVQQESTYNLKPIPYEVALSHSEAFNSVQNIQADVTTIRNKLKERMRTDMNLERERDILWQRFLVDPETMKANYEKAKEKAEKSHFGKS